MLLVNNEKCNHHQARQDTPITQLLMQWQGGDQTALNLLIDQTHEQIQLMAKRILYSERQDHTLQISGLIGESFLRLQDLCNIRWENREHFFTAWAAIMRRVLIDYARARSAAKRGGDCVRITLQDLAADCNTPGNALDAIDLDTALNKLEEFDATLCRLVELRCFSGLKNEQIAIALNISLATVKRKWKLAQTWLYKELKSD